MAVTVSTLLPLHDAASTRQAGEVVSAMMEAGSAVGAIPMTLGGRRYLAVLAEEDATMAERPPRRVAHAA